MNDPTYSPTWEQYLSDIGELCEGIRSAQLAVSAVYGIQPHGIIPAFLIAQQLRVEYTPLALPVRMNGGTMLCVDGFSNRGENLVAYHRDSKTASVYVRDRPDIILQPHYYARAVEGLVRFPYEQLRALQDVRKFAD